jgi:hypothetical protein
MRGMAASGRAFDSDLPADERREAAIEAALETLAPAGMIGIGAAAKQPAKAVLMDILTPTGATKDIAEDTLGDPSRRQFLKGAAATAATAAVAPDVIGEIAEVATKATKTAAKARINPLDMAMANIKELRRQIDEEYSVVNEVLDNPRSTGMLPDEKAAVDEANKAIQTAELEIIEEAYDAIMMMDKADFAEAVTSASDEALEAIIEPQYESIMGNQRLVDDGENSVRLAQEAHRRGLHLAKDENGIDKFPNARAFVEDFYDAVDSTVDNSLIIEKKGVDIPIDSPYYRGLKMTEDRASMGVEDVFRMDQENRKREMMREQLLAEYNRAMEQGLDDAEIDARIATKRRILEQEYGIPFSFADGGVVQRYQEGGMVNTPFADPIKMASPMPAMTRAIGEDGSGNFPIASASTMAVGEDGSSPTPQQIATPGPQQGVGGLFELQNQFQSAMQNVQNNPLELYQGYLGKKYGAPQMEQFQGKIDEFMSLVRQAEEAHFGGGGIGPYASMVGGSGSLPAPVGAMTQAVGEDGGGGAAVGGFASLFPADSAMNNLVSTQAIGEG